MACTVWLRARAEARSVPNGFSMMTPDRGRGGGAEHGHYRLEGGRRDREVEQPVRRAADLPFRPLDGRGRQGGAGSGAGEREPVLECLPRGSCGLAGSEFGDRLAGVLAELLAGDAPAG